MKLKKAKYSNPYIDIYNLFIKFCISLELELIKLNAFNNISIETFKVSYKHNNKHLN